MGVLQNSINAMLGSVSAGASFSAMNIKRMERANERSKKLVQAKVTQSETMKKRRNFMNYVKDIPMEGGKVGDLSKEMQKQIASQYTKAEKTRIMNEADAKRSKK